MIYFDNAATTLYKPPQVGEAVLAAMNHMGNSGRGACEGSLHASRIIYEARAALAGMFGCPGADHVVFTSNATEALNTAIQGIIKDNDHVITTDLEHNSVLRPLYRLATESRAQLSFVKADEMGRVDTEAFRSLIRNDTRAIICNHGSNLTGNLQDIKKIGAIARENGLYFIVDGSQTAGIIPIDMEEMNIDVLCFTGHKSLMGPQGTGGMCIRPGVLIRPLKVGGSGIRTYDREHPDQLPTRLEAGTLNGHGIAGLLAAVKYIEETGMDVIRTKEQALAKAFYEGICKIEGVKVYGDFTTWDRVPIVALNLKDYDSSQVSDELEQVYGISTRPGGHCAPRMHQALGTMEQGAVRFSFSWHNTMEEVEAAIDALMKMSE